MVIEHKQQLLLNSLLEYYKAPSKMQQLMDVIAKKDGLSLRAIDYLCTSFAKQSDVVYYVGKKPFNMYLQYQAQLKAYSKVQFDPFRRHKRITIDVPSTILKEGKIETTIAQLNFFRWALNNKVLEYLHNPKNMERVEQHMNNSSKKKEQKQAKKSSNKVAVKNPHSATLKRHNICVTVTFQ